jgi:predicted N-formylglutamate amidohydrolase
MVTTNQWSKQEMMRIQSDELKDYDENTLVFLSRTTICNKIVELQNDAISERDSVSNLSELLNTFYSQAMESISRRRYIKIRAKDVKECFRNDLVPVYVED